MEEGRISPKGDYSLIYNESSLLFEKFSKLESKKIPNELLDPFFLLEDSAKSIQRKLAEVRGNKEVEASQSLNELLLKVLKKPFLMSSLMKLVFIITQYLLFYFLDNFTETLKDNSKTSDGDHAELKNMATLNLCLMIITLILYSFTGNRYRRYRERCENQMKMALHIILYEKVLKAKICEISEKDNKDNDKNNKSSATGENEEERLDLNNIMTSDIESAMQINWGFQELWSSILSIILSFFMIGLKLSSAFYFCIGITLPLTLMNYWFTNKYIHYYFKMAKVKDKRISLSTDVLQGIKSIKYLSWEKTFLNKINEIRSKEFKNLMLLKACDSMVGFFFFFSPTLMIFATLAWYVQGGNNIYDANAFTILGLINTLIYPLGIIPWSVGRIAEATTSLGRIKRYLTREDINPKKVCQDEQNPKYAIEIKGAKFSWPVENSKEKTKEDSNNEKSEIAETLLENEIKGFSPSNKFHLFVEELLIEKGETYLVLGRVGSGKTALLKSVMNELNHHPLNEIYGTSNSSIFLESLSSHNLKMKTINPSKEIHVNGKIAYVSQNNWLQDFSIRNNILMGTEFDHEWYNICLKACELIHDLGMLPKGDEYIVGPNGSNLSGGQKQRICICRAIYQNADIYLFDDAFSSLDVHVSDNIYKNLILKLLKEMSKTVLFVTSNHNLLTPTSKLIFVNEQHMVITDQERINAALDKLNIDALDESEENIHTQLQLGKKKSSIKEEAQIHSKEEDEEILKKIKVHEKIQEEDEKREEGEISNKTILLYIKAMGFVLCILFLSSFFLKEVARTVSDFWLKSKITPGDTSFSFLDAISADFIKMYAFLMIGVLIFNLFNYYLYFVFAIRTAKQIFKTLMNSIIFSKMSFFDQNETGRIVNRISKDTFTVDEPISTASYNFFHTFFLAISYAFIAIFQFPWMIVVFLLGTLMILQIQKRYREINREMKRLTAINNSKVLNQITETISGVTTIRAFKKEKHFTDVFMYYLNNSYKALYVNQMAFYWTDIRFSLSSSIVFSVLAIVIMILVAFNYEINYSDCSMALIFIYLLNQQLNYTVVYFTELEQNFVSVERIRQYLDNPLEDVNMKPQNSQSIDVLEDEKNCSVVFDKVCLTYNKGTSSRYALNNVSFSIKKGEKVAFCGRTGSGKTSILNALFKLYDIESGDVRFGGAESINNLSLSEIRSRIAIIPQFGFLYRASLKENLDPEGKCDENYLKEILSKSGFVITGSTSSTRNEDGNIETSENNLEAKIENSGSNLSNGEKQIINFLRILIKNNDIICLDEATSNMDPKTDKELHEALFQFSENKTLIVITHRLEHIEKYDRVFVMQDGEIVEQGHVNELRRKKDSFFKDLYENK